VSLSIAAVSHWHRAEIAGNDTGHDNAGAYCRRKIIAGADRQRYPHRQADQLGASAGQGAGNRRCIVDAGQLVGIYVEGG
jgi:hypothetical protein